MARALDTSNIGGNAQVVLTPGAGLTVVITAVAYSYSGVPATGKLLIEDDSPATIFDLDVRDTGANIIAQNLDATPEATVTITLSGVATLRGKLVVFYGIV